MLLLLIRTHLAPSVVLGAARLASADQLNASRTENFNTRPIQASAQRASAVSVSRPGNYQTSRRT